MGSSGSGRFSDYSGAERQSEGRGGESGGSSGGDRCRQAFSVSLEDVGLYSYFSKTGTVPTVGTALTLTFRTRILAADAAGVEIGALPTPFNYLAACIRDGISYTGVVTNSSALPAPRVDVDFVPV
ncbi:hypothetical protein GQF56_16080 [Rhodobacter sphaeroides]|uniref:Uncharacterized protein n=1 Tax=Cereibacter sphaeroides (strain ATCC 17023 / DSM 158 / JCM 6121 / CCUG 31486 / LMG 2827 / NBRC 12203 / NCIMB 8253 / ATH 2.4.1.) TaxID=272943 RepID=Q3IW32_CERS4|nr:hypothetical protein RSP_3640 [Cereibacter sphaeroides 2.4.1]AXC63545.1 hypothetical protein DQL45_19390 [Cereibacter sphaeroides 2.4.1]MVX49371.1 hypothetical protein [Cereibacter sphaeroides]QHA11965.1 hypothetical protein GQR99_19365 [Cereibacter sphaeroides]QHA15121.1 hypothetical protein GQY06_19330 [Cereibacter sphaeroides]